MHNDKKAYQVDRTPTELLSDLLVQLKFLRQECLHYDAGDWSYGAQIATKLRLLLHQTKYSDPCWPKLQSVLHSAVRIFSV